MIAAVPRETRSGLRAVSTNGWLQLYEIPVRWSFRQDVGCKPEYQLFDVYAGTRYEISQSLFIFLNAWSSSLFSFDDVLAWRDSANFPLPDDQTEALLQVLIRFGIIVQQPVIHKTSGPRPAPTLPAPVVAHGFRIPSSPREAELHLTRACNLRCLHCGYDAGCCRGDELGPSSWIKVVDELEALGTGVIIISGGEPLLYSGCKMLLSHVATKRMKVEFLTNGTLIDKPTAELLASRNIATTISLDGANAVTHDHLRGTGSFARTLESLHILAERGISFHLEMTVHRSNIIQIAAAADLAALVGATSLTFGVLYKVGRARSAADLLLTADDIELIGRQVTDICDAAKHAVKIAFVDPRHPIHRNLDGSNIDNLVYCPGGTARIAIRSDGTVFPCAYGFCSDDFRAGSVVQQSIAEIWRTGEWGLFRGYPAERLPQCSKCSLNQSCLLKICRLMAFAATGDFYSPAPGCDWLLGLAQKSGYSHKLETAERR